MAEKKKPVVYISIDCEVDGPAPPARGSMFWFGAVLVDRELKTTFNGQLHPISDYYEPARLAISGLTREQTLLFPKPEIIMPLFARFVYEVSSDRRPVLISDNNGFDAGLMNYYLWTYAGENPLGHTSRNINDLYKGLQRDTYASFKHLVKTPHDHNPVNDAIGHAEAFQAFAPELKIKI